MATNLNQRFPTKSNPPDANYPSGSIKNETNPGVTDDGTPLDADIGNDVQGFFQSTLDRAGVTANNNPESVSNPQVLDALMKLSGEQSNAGDSQIAGGKIWPVDDRDTEINDKPISATIFKFTAVGIRTLYKSKVPISGKITSIGAVGDTVDITVAGNVNTLIKIHREKPLLFASDFNVIGEYKQSDMDRLVAEINSKSSVVVYFDKELVLTSPKTKYSTNSITGPKSVVFVTPVVDDRIQYNNSEFDIYRMFDVTDVDNVDVIQANVKSTCYDVGGNKNALEWMRATGFKKLKVSGVFDKCQSSIHGYDGEIIEVDSVNSDTRYPLRTNNVKSITGKMVNNGCRRDFFLNAPVSNANLVVDSTDLQQGCIIENRVTATDFSREASNIDIKYKHRSTGRYQLFDRAAPINLVFLRESGVTEQITPASMRNINIEYDVDGGYFGSIIGLPKYIDPNLPDMTGRAYKLQALKITGRIKLGSESADSFYFNWQTSNNWVSGDYIYSIDLNELTVIHNVPGKQLAFNPEIIMGAIADFGKIKLDSLVSPSAVFANDKTIDYNRKLLFNNTILRDWTTDDARGQAQSTLVRRGWSEKATGDPGVKVCKIDTSKCVVALSISINAYYSDDFPLNYWFGEFKGQVGATAGGVWNLPKGAFIEHDKGGVVVTPTLTIAANGEVSLNLPEWSASKANLQLKVEMIYANYDDEVSKYPRGIVSKKYAILF